MEQLTSQTTLYITCIVVTVALEVLYAYKCNSKLSKFHDDMKNI